jgi:hypothetical protein
MMDPTAPASSSIVHRVDHDRGVVFVAASGNVTADALRAAHAALNGDPKFSSGMDVYIECRVLTGMPTPEELRGMALTSILHRGDVRHGRMAIVATTARSYEAISIFEFFCETSRNQLAIFTDRSAACAWLGIDRVLLP